MRPDHIILHCSDTKDSGTVSWGAIRRYHIGILKWSDIGYHFGIELVNDQYEIFVGRTLDRRGAHCRAAGMNSRSIGICFVGRFDYEPPPPEQLALGHKICRWLVDLFEIPLENILGHRHFEENKTCPGRMFDTSEFQIEVSRR